MELKKLILDLDWHKPVDIQQQAIKELSNLTGKDVVLLAHQSNELCHKACWQNASLVLNQIGYPNNKEALPFLMRWFQDTNWPGVDTITELLESIDTAIITPIIEHAISLAIQENDQDWGYGLLLLLHRLKIDDFYNSNVMSDLKTLADYDFD